MHCRRARLLSSLCLVLVTLLTALVTSSLPVSAWNNGQKGNTTTYQQSRMFDRALWHSRLDCRSSC